MNEFTWFEPIMRHEVKIEEANRRARLYWADGVTPRHRSFGATLRGMLHKPRLRKPNTHK